jgi:hypothetical protein
MAGKGKMPLTIRCIEEQEGITKERRDLSYELNIENIATLI